MANTGSKNTDGIFDGWLSNTNVSMVKTDPELHLESLEERVLYSAVPMPLDLVEHVQVSEGMDDVDVFSETNNSLDLINNGIEGFFESADSESDMDLVSSTLNHQELGDERTEIVFVDQTVGDFQQLIDDILNRADPNTHYEIAILDPNSNGLEQISRTLNESSSLDKQYNAVHLVTHGSDATLNLGNTQVNGANLHGYAHEFISWQDALSVDADILIYGCEVAETEFGEQFVQELSDLTGADIAASDDVTGHSTLGGDWEFEVFVGQIETGSAFSSSIEASWMNSLVAIATAEMTGESGTATGRSLAINDSQTIIQVFASDTSVGDGLDIFYQITDENGTQDAVLVNSGDWSGQQHSASVAIDNDGDFVVVWTDELGSGDQGVFAKYYAADGSVIRDEFRIDAVSSGGNDASVAMDANGNFVVAWEGSGAQDSDGIYAQRFDTTGNTVGGTFLVNDVASAALTQGNADVAMNDSGQFVIAWDDFNSIYSESNIYARWFDTDGTPAGSNEMLVDSDSTRVYLDPSVAINNSGNFVVAYTLDTDQDVKDGGDLAATIANSTATGVNVQTYSVSGTTVSNVDENLVNQSLTGDQHSPSVTLLDNDELIVVWEGRGNADDGSGSDVEDTEGVFYRQFDLSGNSLTPGGESFVSTNAIAGAQQDAVIASNGAEFVFGFDNAGDALSLETSFNYAPVSQNASLTVPVGFEYTFTLSDFSFFDADGDELASINVEAVPNTSQGELLLNGSSIATGSVSRSQIENGELTFVTASSSIGSIGSINYRSVDQFGSISDQARIDLSAEFSDMLLFSTEGSQTYDSQGWDEGDLVAFGGPDLTLGTPTAGDVFALMDTTFAIDAFHLVTNQTVIDLGTAVTLNVGDVLFSVSGTTTDIPGIASTTKGDIVLFQPASANDYDPGTGTFTVLTTIPGDNDLTGLTLVEADTTIGDTIVTKGSFLFADDGSSGQIQLLEITGGSHSKQTLFNANDIGIDSEIYGLELVEEADVVGGFNLTEGTILLSAKDNKNDVGTSSLIDIQNNDVVALNVTSTQLGSGVSEATASLFYDASTISGLSGGGAGDIDAVALLSSHQTEQLVNNTGLTVQEGMTTVVDSSMLLTNDIDTVDSDLVYTVPSKPAGGRMLLNGVESSTFTQQDVNDGLVSFAHDGSETTSVAVVLNVNDGFGAGTDFTFNVTVTPVNDVAQSVNNNTPTFYQGVANNVITSGMLSYSDSDDPAEDITYTLVSETTSGVLNLDGTPLSAGDTFTQKQIDDNLLTYSHDDSNNSNDSFEFNVSDGELTTSNSNFDITIDTSKNDAPVLTLGTMNIVENSTNNVVSNAVLSAVDGDVADGPANLTFEVRATSTGGTLYLNGIALANGDVFTQEEVNLGLITYSHSGGESAADVIGLRLSDGLEDGVVAQDFDLVFNVTNVNDAPVATVNSASVNEGSTGNVIDSSYLNATDVDVADSAANLTYEVTDIPEHGQFLLNGIVLGVGDTFSQQDVNDGNVTYDHDGTEQYSDSIGVSLSDGLEDGVVAQSATLLIDIVPLNDPISGLNSGIEINTDGEDAYFIATDGDALFGGSDEFTFEVTLSSTDAATATLGSYRTPSDTTENDDAFRIAKLADGTLSVKLNGHDLVSTGYDYTQLADGELHSLSFSWSNASGNWQVSVDGQIVDHGDGLASGETVRSGGTFVFGHEQDSVDGGYTNDNEFKGRVYDVRVWDNVQSATELAQNYQEQFTSDNLPDGLLANWQFDELQSGTTVVDVVSGNDLILQRVAGFGVSSVFDTLQVDENSANGTSVGFVMPVDSEYYNDVVLDGSFTDSTEPSGGGSFDFDEYLAGSMLGDWEVTQNSVDLRGSTWGRSPLGGRALDLTGDSGQGAIQQTLTTVIGQTYTISFQMSANYEGLGNSSTHSLDVNVAGTTNSFSHTEQAGWSRSNLQWEQRSFTFTATSTTTVLEFESTTGTNRGPMISDVGVVEATALAAENLTYSLSNSADGRFAIDASTGEITVADGTKLDFESNASHFVIVDVEDGDGQVTSHNVAINIGNVNDGASFGSTNLMVSEGSSANVITSVNLNAIDVDTANIHLVYTVESLPGNGDLLLNGTALSVNDSFTQADVNNGLVTFDHDGSETTSDSISLELDDGASTRTVGLDIDVSPTNDAPVATAGLAVNLPDVIDDNTNPAGTTVQSLLDGAGPASHSDADGDVLGMAVVGVDDSNGQWQYSIDDGATWQSFSGQGVATSGTDDTNAVFLDENAQVRFVPNLATGQLWFSTSSQATVGADTVEDNQIAQFGSADDEFEMTTGTTSGTIDVLDGFDAPGTVRALHYVESDIAIGDVPNTVQLQKGDLIIAFSDNNTTLNDGDPNQFNADRRDMVVFRPGSTSDYTEANGEWFMLLNNGLENRNVHALTLVERNTVVGDVELQAGTFLVAHSNPQHISDIRTVEITDAGDSPSTVVSDLILGSSLGTNSQIQGLHLVQQDTTFDDTMVAAGTILVEVNYPNTYAGVSHTANDVLAIDVTQTQQGSGTTSATGYTLFQGDDIGLSSSIDGFTIVSNFFDDGNSSNAGDAGDISFRVWDQSDGNLSGSLGDASYTDVASSVSNNVATAAISIDSSDGVSTDVPGIQTTEFEERLVFSTANGNAIVVSGSEPLNNEVIRVVVEVSNGVLNLNSAALGSVVVSSSAPDGTGLIVFAGYENDVNAALDGLTFTPDNGFDGAVDLNVTSDFQYSLEYSLIDSSGLDPACLVNDPDRGQVVQMVDANHAIEITDLDGNPTQLGQPQTLTVAGWVNMDGSSGNNNNEFISIGDAVTIRLDALSQGVTGFFNQGGSSFYTSSSVDIAGTGWHHIAYSIDAASQTQTLYIDGVAIATTNHTAGIDYQNEGTFIGRHPTSNGFNLDGSIDDVFVFNRALSATEVKAMFAESYQDTDTISIVVNENLAPVANGNNIGIVAADTSTVITEVDALVNDTDPENDTLQIASFGQPDNGTVVRNVNGDFVYTPNAGYTGPDGFEYTISDGTSNQSTAKVQFMVNDVPVAMDESFAVVQDNSLNGDVSANDSDSLNGGLTYVLESDANNGTLTLNADGTFSYTPDPGFFGTDTFEYSIDDGLNQSEVATVNFSVQVPPIAIDDQISVNFGEQVTLTFVANDSDPDGDFKDVTIEVLTSPNSGQVATDLLQGTISYRAIDDGVTNDQLTYRLVDADGLVSAVATVNITINHAPESIALSNDIVDENASAGTVVGSVTAKDLNDDIVSFQLQDNDGIASNNPFRIDPTTGIISVRNSSLLDFETTTSFEETVIVTDAAGLATVQTFTINVNPIDEAPVGGTITRTVDEGGRISGDLSLALADPEGDIDKYELENGPRHGNLKFQSDGRWTYQHDDTENYSDEFTFSVRDHAGNVTLSTVKLDVNPIDDVPVAVGDNFNTDAATAVELKPGELLGNDENIKTNSTIEIVTQTSNGTLVQNPDGTIVYTPDVTFDGQDFFEYRVVVDDQVSATTRVNFSIRGLSTDAVASSATPDASSSIVDVPTPADEVETETVEVQPEPESTETTPVVEQLLVGPINSDRDAQTGGSFNVGNESDDTDLAAVGAEESKNQQDFTSNLGRQLLWQPRYAIYGNQMVINASLNDYSSNEELTLQQALADYTGLSVGLSDKMFNDLDQQATFTGGLSFADVPILGLSASSVFTVGYLVWAVRAGALVSTFMSFPAWTQFDPLPVIESGIPGNIVEDDDSLESLVDTV